MNEILKSHIAVLYVLRLQCATNVKQEKDNSKLEIYPLIHNQRMIRIQYASLPYGKHCHYARTHISKNISHTNPAKERLKTENTALYAQIQATGELNTTSEKSKPKEAKQKQNPTATDQIQITSNKVTEQDEGNGTIERNEAKTNHKVQKSPNCKGPHAT